MLWTASQVLRKFSTSSVSNVANNHRGLMRELLWLREHRFSKCVCVALNACSGLRVMRRTEPGSGLTALILSKSLSCCIFSQHGKRWCTLYGVNGALLLCSSRCALGRSWPLLYNIWRSCIIITGGSQCTGWSPAYLRPCWAERGSIRRALSFLIYLPCRLEVAVQQQPDLSNVHLTGSYICARETWNLHA